MSRVFSVSLVAIMVMVSVLGITHPVGVAASVEATPPAVEVAPEDMSAAPGTVVPETVETTQSVAEATEPTEPVAEEAPSGDVPEVTEPPESVAEDASVVDAHAEQQTPVSDDAASRPAPGMIVPNAVDPNPGDCPVDEICDGGGGEVPKTVTVAIAVTQSTQLSEGATVVVKTSGNAPVGSRVTGANGVVEFELSVGETYLVDVSKVGYQPQTGVSLTVPGDTSTLSINLLPVFGKVNVTVTDSVTGEPVPYAIVRFTGKSGTVFNVNTNSGSTGRISPSMQSGVYSAFFSHPDYVSQQFDVTVVVGDSISIQLVPEEQEPVQSVLSLEVVDKVTGEPIPGAIVILREPSPSSVVVSEGTTDANGRWDSSPLTGTEYDLWILEPFHRVYMESISGIPTSVQTIELDPGPEITATYTVVDVETDEPIQGAVFTVKEYSSGTQIAAGQTDADGTWTFNPTLGNGYWVTIEKAGYQTLTTYVYVRGDYSKTVQMMPPGYPGSVTFSIYDSYANLTLPGATITISNGEVTETLLTDEAGMASLESFASGTYDLTIVANGYETYVGTVEIRPGITLTTAFHLESRPASTLVVQLQAPVTGAPIVLTNVGTVAIAGMSGPTVNQVTSAVQPIAGQTVQVVNPDTGIVMVDGVTDADGMVTLLVARQGTYRLNVTVEGYEPYSALYELTEDSEHVIMLQPIGVDNPGEPDPGTGEPGDGDDDTPTNPEPGDGDGNGDGDVDNPGNPDPGNPDTGSNPGTDGGSGDDQGTNPGTDSPDAGSKAVADNGAASAQRAVSPSVDMLPSTGVGTMQSSLMFTAVMIVAGLGLMSAAIRRLAR